MNKLKARLLARNFRLWQRLGLHVTPNHFYEPVPNTRTLREELWSGASQAPGIDLALSSQLDLLHLFAARYSDEYETFPSKPTSSPWQYYLDNPQFTKVDAEVLFCMVRYLRPSRIIEIGSGFSTLVSAQAILANERDDPGYQCSLIAIEPYPNGILTAGFPGLTELLIKPVQDVPISLFESLGERDILFIDSSHVLKIGSDVQYEFLQVLPRIAKGVFVQIHDIFLPAEYPKHMVIDWHRFWSEQYVLQAFLTLNPHFRVRFASCYLHDNYPNELEKAFPSYRREGWPTGLPPCSFWMERVA